MRSLPTRSCPILLRNHAAEEEGTQESWAFKSVTGHQGPMTSRHKEYKGSSYNVLVKWDDGCETYEPLDIIMKDDPIMLAQYGEDNRLLDTPGWKKLKRLVKNKKMFAKIVKQAKLTSQRHGLIYQFGIQVHCNVNEALAFDETNGNQCGRKPWMLS
jgi:hypothetical protein